jgi:hypothetical protein
LAFSFSAGGELRDTSLGYAMRHSGAELSGKLPIDYSQHPIGNDAVPRTYDKKKNGAPICSMTPEEARAKALQCEQKALATQDDVLVRMYTGLAHQWRQVAEQVERESLAGKAEQVAGGEGQAGRPP